MRQFSVVAVAVLACVAYAMQAKAGTEPPCPIGDFASAGVVASPTFVQTKETQAP
jgi:hypothetical protein